MPRKIKSAESRIAEHEKHRRQCKLRIRPSLTLCLLAIAFAGIFLWYRPDGWGLAAFIVGFPVLFTSLEVWGYFRHDRAIKELQGGP